MTDYDANGLARQVSTGAHAPTPAVLYEDPLFYPSNSAVSKPWTFETVTNGPPPTTGSGSSSPTGYGSITQMHSDNASMSDLYHDVTGLRPGTYAKVSVWASLSINPCGSPCTTPPPTGGVQLWIDDGLLPNLSGLDAPVQRVSAIVQPSGPSWVQLVIPFFVDQTGKIRIHRVHLNVRMESVGALRWNCGAAPGLYTSPWWNIFGAHLLALNLGCGHLYQEFCRSARLLVPHHRLGEICGKRKLERELGLGTALAGVTSKQRSVAELRTRIDPHQRTVAAARAGRACHVVRRLERGAWHQWLPG